MNLAEHPELKKYESFYPSGTVVFSEGDQARDLYILVSGRLDVVKGEKKISEISDPDFFGELSFLLGTVRIASVITAEDSHILRFPSDEVNTLWKKFPEFGEHMAKILAKRLHDTTNIAYGFREFCDQMPEAVIMTDTDHRVLSWNKAAEDLYGRKWEHMRDKPIEEIYDNQAAFQQFIAELPELGSVSPKTLKINHPGKDWFFVSTSTTLLKDSRNHIQGYLFLGRDATGHQQLAIKHQQVKKWMNPLLIIITLLTGWLLWENISSSQQNFSITEGSTTAFHSKLTQEIQPLEFALPPLLAAGSTKAADLTLKHYFHKNQPYLIGIKGLMILDRNKKVLNVHSPNDTGLSSLIGTIYDGTKYPGNGIGKNSKFDIYLAERPEDAGGGSVEALVDIKDAESNIHGWLVIRLDPETIENKYYISVKDLAIPR